MHKHIINERIKPLQGEAPSEEIIKEDFGVQEKTKFLAKTVDFFKINEDVNIESFKETYVAFFSEVRKNSSPSC